MKLVNEFRGDSYSVSFVIPCLNEESNIEHTIISCHNSANKFFIKDYEILVIDNGSIDNSKKIAQQNNAQVIEEKIKGYGSAIRKGIASAKKEFILILDADSTYDPDCLREMLNLYEQKNLDLVIGNRFDKGIEKGAMSFLHKFLGNPLLSSIGKYLFDVNVKDFHCGIRLLKTELFQNIPLKTNGMEFASEMIALASIYKLKIGEVSTTLKKSPKERTSHLNTWKDGWRHLALMISMSPRKSYLNLSLISGIISIFLFFRFIIFDSIYFTGINTLIASLACMFCSISFLREYIELKIILKNRVSKNTLKNKENIERVYKKLLKISILTFLSIPVIISLLLFIITLTGYSLQEKNIYLLSSIFVCLGFISLQIFALSIRLNILKLN